MKSEPVQQFTSGYLAVRSPFCSKWHKNPEPPSDEGKEESKLSAQNSKRFQGKKTADNSSLSTYYKNMMQMEKSSRRGGLGAQAAPEHEVAKVR